MSEGERGRSVSVSDSLITRRSALQRAGFLLTAASVPSLLAACGGSSGSGGGGGARIFRVGSTLEVDSLNPFVATNDSAFFVNRYMYPYLVGNDDQLRVVPDYAKSWRLVDGGRKIVFDLTPGGRWSDGKPLTAEDAAWTIETILRYGRTTTANKSGSLEGVKRARAVGTDTLELIFEQPLAPGLANLVNIPILPKHVWQQVATGRGDRITSFATKVPIVCGGAFTVESNATKQSTILKRNEGFYGPRPHVESFGIRFYGTSDAVIEALRQGELDGVTLPASRAIASLERDARIRVYDAPGLFISYVMFNSNPRKTAHRELLEPDVRRALYHAIDCQRITDDVYSGKGTLGASVIPPASVTWHDEAIQAVSFDVDEANALLDAAGLRRGAGGVRVADGQPMRYELLRAQAEAGRVCEIVQEGWREVGVDVKIRPMDPNALLAAIMAPDGKYLDYDVAQWSWAVPPDPDYLLSAFTTGAYGGLSDSAFSSPEYDRLYQEQRQETDERKRQQLVYRMQQILFEQLPYLVLLYRNGLGAAQASWEGLNAGPSGPLPLSWKKPLLSVQSAS
jgi:peptide/nickel transport system substrate-binding protein